MADKLFLHLCSLEFLLVSEQSEIPDKYNCIYWLIQHCNYLGTPFLYESISSFLLSVVVIFEHYP
jgi:hypothetical protein